MLYSPTHAHLKHHTHTVFFQDVNALVRVLSLLRYVCVWTQVFSWGDNDHGQQGNGTVTANRKPQLITGLKEHRITKISCGSSHCVAFAAGTPATTGEFSPVSFPVSQDALGSSLLAGRAGEGAGEDEMKRPSLTKIVLSLTTPAKQQEALGHMQTALQIAYARSLQYS